MEQALIEKILAETTGPEHEAEVKQARDEYFWQLKDLREDDPSYELLTSCFLNWYVFDRPMDSGSGTPLQVYAASQNSSEDEQILLAAMAANVHSLFEVVRLDEGALHLRDLFNLEPLKVSERRRLAGLENGDILEARLIPVQGKLVFISGAFVLHPRAARRLIYKAVERSRAAGIPSSADLMQRLQALNFRFTDRYRQRIPVEKVYAEIESFNIPDRTTPASEPE